MAKKKSIYTLLQDLDPLPFQPDKKRALSDFMQTIIDADSRTLLAFIENSDYPLSVNDDQCLKQSEQ